jgi:cytoskeletal protein CcmA (bactofilin family)
MNLNNLTSSSSSDLGGNAKNILTNDVEVTGTLKFASELIFDGKIDGEIVSDGVLTLGKNAHVKGEVKTKSVTVHGTVEGNITVTERCELKSSSQLTGDLRATRIMIEEGATFVGKSEVTPARAVTRDSSSSSAASGEARSRSTSTPTTATAPTAS